ncbi:hypothetical protein ACWEF9_38605 [Streptomyces sp. NPDC004980]
MVDLEVQERIAVRRAELDDLEEQLVKQLTEVRSERGDLAAAERVLARMGEQIAAERAATAPAAVQWAGRRCCWFRTVARCDRNRAPAGVSAHSRRRT